MLREHKEDIRLESTEDCTNITKQYKQYYRRASSNSDQSQRTVKYYLCNSGHYLRNYTYLKLA